MPLLRRDRACGFRQGYQKVDGLRLPQKDETVVQVRFYGKKVLSIDHRDYVLKGVGRQRVPYRTSDDLAGKATVACHNFGIRPTADSAFRHQCRAKR